MKKVFTLLLAAILTFSISAANFVWIGGASGDWNVGANWNQSGALPTPTDDVQFNASASVFNTGATPTVNRLVVGLSVVVTLDLDLNITSTATNAVGIQLSADNSILNLGNGTDARTFTISAGTDNSRGVRLFRAGSVLNVASGSTLDIVQADIGIYQHVAAATFNNNGTVNITNYEDYGIRLTLGTFNNDGEVTISSPATGSLEGIRVETTLTNNAAGTLTVTEAEGDGIWVAGGGTLTNAGTLNTTLNGAPDFGEYGLDVSGTFINESGAVYNGDGGTETGDNNARAFGVTGGTVSNNGLMSFSGGNPVVRLFTTGDFTNLACARIDLGTGGRAFQGAGTFTNNGYMETTFVVCIQSNGGTAVNNAFYTSGTAWGAEVGGTTPDNGAEVPVDLDAAGGCTVDFSTASAGMISYSWGYDGTTIGSNDAAGVLDLTGADFPNAAGPHTITITDNGCSEYNTAFTVTVADVCAQAVLAVEWLDFTARAQGAKVMLNWSTAGEVDNDYFSVEKLIDGREFVAIGKVYGAGNSSQIERYEFVDAAPARGVNYYRLQQMDFDGHFEYSTVVSVNYEAAANETELLVYPNPVRGLLNIPQIGGRAAIYDLNGRLLADFQLTEAAYDASVLAEGIYLLTVTDEAGTVRQTRFVVRRD